MDYIIDQLSKYIKEGKNEEALNLLSLYRMTIESRSTYNPKYFELIQPKFDPALFRAFKKWKTKQKRSNKMKIYNVVFHRHYEVPESIIQDDKYDTLEEAAECIARDWLTDEMPEFLNNTEDFMSATIEEK